jgi:hypothetical protein
MRLHEEPFQPAIVTMTSKRLEGTIYDKIMQDNKTKRRTGKSNYWSWEPGDENTYAVGTSVAADAANSVKLFEYDVVKKRRAMDAVSPTPAADDDPDALSEFEDFERNVLPALEAILEDERNNQRKELEELEENISKGILPTTTGGVYFAWSSCLKCMKIGATRRDDPAIRLRELSRHVTTPFVLMGWIPTPTPFRRESVAHRHFVSKRIRNAGAGTEFFHIGREEAEAYCGGGGV